MADSTTCLKLAEIRFNQDIWPAERRLFEAAASGEDADCTKLAEKDRIIRADRLSWLCTDRAASAGVTYRGVSITGAKIDGDVDLAWATIPFRITVDRCVLPGTVDISRSCLSFLNLGGSSVGRLKANTAKFGGDVLLRNGFKAEAGVDLVTAQIDGNLDCSRGQFAGKDFPALNANGVRISGSVFLRGASAQGGVVFLGACIDGPLECDAGKFVGSDRGPALNVNLAQIKGSVFLRNGFKAEGLMILAAAQIDGVLDCTGGQFTGREDLMAFDASNTTVAGSVVLRYVNVKGGVVFSGAQIDGVLDCSGGQFVGNDKTLALNANRAVIKSSVYLRNGFKAEGGVDLTSAKIGGNLECIGGEFIGNGNTLVLEAGGAKIEGNVLLRDGFKADGEVSFFHCYIGSSFQWVDVNSPEKAILDLRLTKLGTLFNGRDSWPIQGKLRLDGLTYDQIDDSAPPYAEAQLGWLHRQPLDKFLSQPYEQLAAVLGKMGLEEDARKVMIEKNKDHARHLHWRLRDRHFPLAWLWYGLAGKIIGYGYRPWRAFWMSGALIVIGCLLFNGGYLSKIVTPTEKEAYAVYVDKNGKGDHFERYPVFDPFIYSVETFVPFLKVGISQYWMPNANRGIPVNFGLAVLPTGSLLRYYLCFHIIAGWVLTTLWVGGITGLVKT